MGHLTLGVLEAEKFHRMISKGPGDPGLAPDEVGDLDTLGLLDGGDDLDGAAATPDDPDSLALETLPRLVSMSVEASRLNKNELTFRPMQPSAQRGSSYPSTPECPAS